jgi:hypothetical protein
VSNIHAEKKTSFERRRSYATHAKKLRRELFSPTDLFFFKEEEDLSFSPLATATTTTREAARTNYRETAFVSFCTRGLFATLPHKSAREFSVGAREKKN